MIIKPKIYFCWTYLVAKISFMAYCAPLSYCHHCFQFNLNNRNLYLVCFLPEMCSSFPIYFPCDYCLIQCEAKMIILISFFYGSKCNLHWKRLFFKLKVKWSKRVPDANGALYFSKIRRVRFMTDFWPLFCLLSVPPQKMNGLNVVREFV